jgi:hypothetical protein
VPFLDPPHMQHRGFELFRLTDATGKVVGVFPVHGRGDDVH